MLDNGNRLYLRSRRHLYAHLQISQRRTANNARPKGNLVPEGEIWNSKSCHFTNVEPSASEADRK